MLTMAGFMECVDATLVAAVNCMAGEVVILSAGLTLRVHLKGITITHCDRGMVTEAK